MTDTKPAPVPASAQGVSVPASAQGFSVPAPAAAQGVSVPAPAAAQGGSSPVPASALLGREDADWACSLLPGLRGKFAAELGRVGSAIPYISEDGRYKEDKSLEKIHWWTNGFWPGILWQMHALTGDEAYAETAREVERKLDRALLGSFEKLNHDVGFMWLHSAVADWRATANPESRTRALHAATILAGRFNPAGRFIRAWNFDQTGWIIVDSMMNIPLLFWASDQTGDPRFSYVARAHADTVLRTIVRPDGSVNHIAILDPDTGDFLEAPKGQGYAAGSSWSRGQSWALYGFALAYRHTGDARYLDAAKRVAHYFCAQVAMTDDLPRSDFRAPAEPVIWDSTAGCCAASGLVELAGLVGEMERDFYLAWALRILRATEACFCDWDPSRDGLVQMGTVSWGVEAGMHAPIIYGDYFFLEAVLKLTGDAAFLW